MYNSITLIGHLGREPEMSYTPSGRAVTKFSVATSRKWKDEKGGKQEHTDWFNVTAWQQLAETCNAYLHKGSKVFIEGRMESRTYTGKDGVERTAWDVIASNLVMLDGKPAGERSGAAEVTADDGIPF